jgi:hypothetical protein
VCQQCSPDALRPGLFLKFKADLKIALKVSLREKQALIQKLH